MTTVLIVDDSRVTQHIVRRILQSQDYAVHTANDGLLGLEQLAANPYDLIISDINMPNCDGFEFVAQVRNSGNTVPIIMLTATGDENNKIRAQALGVNGFLTQPFDSANLLEIVDGLLVAI